MVNFQNVCTVASRRMRSLCTVNEQGVRAIELQGVVPFRHAEELLPMMEHHNCLRQMHSASQLDHESGSITRFCRSFGFGGGVVLRKAWDGVRFMGSSKTKEQPRGSLWRTRSVISKETVQAVHDLRRNKHNPRELNKVLQTRVPRLLKMDLLATLSELQRQNEITLALQIFDIVRKEMWYKPDKFLYRSMMDALGRNRMIPDLEKKFQELQDEGIVPDVVIYREMVGAYVRIHMLPRALEIHEKMIEIGCGDDRLSLSFIEKGKLRLEKKAEKLKAADQQEMNSEVEADSMQT